MIGLVNFLYGCCTSTTNDESSGFAGKADEKEDPSTLKTCATLVVFLFIFVWNVYGAVITYTCGDSCDGLTQVAL